MHSLQMPFVYRSILSLSLASATARDPVTHRGVPLVAIDLQAADTTIDLAPAEHLPGYSQVLAPLFRRVEEVAGALVPTDERASRRVAPAVPSTRDSPCR